MSSTARDWSFAQVVLGIALGLGCGAAPQGEGPDGGGADGGTVDGASLDASIDAWVCEAANLCGTACCTSSQVCVVDQCVPNTPCASNDDCADDSYCDPDLDLCVPYDPGATDPACTQVSVVGVFAPSIQCEWTGPPGGDAHPDHRNVLATPMVVDFNFDNDPATIAPSILFASYNGTDGVNNACVGNATYYGVIRILDGQTCTQQHSIATPSVVASGPLAVGDLDGDGRAEIVAHRIGGGMVAFRYDSTTSSFVTYWQTVSTLGAGTCNWAGPSLYDLNNDGLPEVIMGGSVFNGTDGTARSTILGLRSASNGQIPVIADLAGDGKPELLTGDAIYEWDVTLNAGLGGWVNRASGQGATGLVAVADFGTYGATAVVPDDRAVRDGIPEVVVVSSGQVRIQTLTGRVIHGPITLLYFAPATNPGSGGPPTIADFDGDGRAETAVAGRGGYNVFDPDCTGTPEAATCASLRTDGILWAMPTQDLSSSVTGSSVFDFEGDGSAEVVYADECFSRVYDGESGDILYSAYRSSCTWYENPVVADVDGDFNSEVVIPSNNNCGIVCPTLDPQFDGLRCIDDSECPAATTCGYESPSDPTGRCRCTTDADCGGNGYVCRDPIAGPSAAGQVCRAGHPGVAQRGIRVIRDALDRWVNSRPIWNQHAYSVTHVTDTGGVPSTSTWQRNWLVAGLNNFRQAIAGDPESSVSPDLTGQDGSYECGPGGVTLSTQVCNRGTEPVGVGIPVAFYEGDPSAGGTLACVAFTQTVMLPGACETVSCGWAASPAAASLTLVADDDGTGSGASTECHEGNNRGQMTGVTCIDVD